MTLPIPAAARAEYTALVERHHPRFPPTHDYAGTNTDRAAVGDPGHCEICAALGHVRAHPDYGCGDVGCTHAH